MEVESLYCPGLLSDGCFLKSFQINRVARSVNRSLLEPISDQADQPTSWHMPWLVIKAELPKLLIPGDLPRRGRVVQQVWNGVLAMLAPDP